MTKWPLVPLSDLVDRRTTKNIDGHDIVMTVSAAHGLVDQETYFQKRVASKDLSGYWVLERGDFVYNKSASKDAPWGVVARYEGEEPAVVTPLYLAFRAKPGVVDPDYLLLACNGETFFDSLAGLLREGARAHGALNVRVGEFFAASVPLPPLVEQRRIVDVMAAVDAQIEALEAESELLDSLWWEQAAVLETECADVPTAALADISEISGGLTKNKKDFEAADLVEVPYLRVANVHRRYLDLTNVATIQTTAKKAAALTLQEGDLLLNEGGDKDKLGRGAVWRNEVPDCIHQNHVFRARVTSPEHVAEFVSAWANSFGQRWFETFGTQTTGIASINKTTLGRFPVPVLGTERQRAWARRLDAIWASHEAIRAQSLTLRAFRATLLAALLSQQVEIPESYDALLDDAVGVSA